MNQTAKKLREEADFMSGVAVSAAETIVMARNIFGIEPTDTFGGDLGRVLETIADELDELQARAAGANNLRQQLESAEKKAERRKQHIWYLETALHDKNALLEQRGGTIARLTAENGKLRKQVPSERERQILDMWPKFEDGEYVWFGDRVYELCGKVYGVCLDDDAISLRTAYLDHMPLDFGERVKRLEPEVLDADGVEIKVGDTVWFKGNPRPYAVVEVKDGIVRLYSKTHCSEESATSVFTDILTHTPPDSWERLEEDASKEPCDYFGVEHDEDKGCSGCPHLREGRDCTIALQADLIRRAKALAGVEVD